MSEHAAFELRCFLSLSGPELVDYVEPVLAALTISSDSAAEMLLSELPSLDEQHLVYGLELGMRLAPDLFTNGLFTFLAHRDSSVCSTAYRLLARIAPGSAPVDFREKVAATPTVELFTPNPETSERVHVGTNVEFIRSLLNQSP